MPPVLILTPDPDDASYAGSWPTVLERLRAVMALEGIEAQATPWTAHADDASALSDAALVLPLVVWGYHREPDRWLDACEAWGEVGVAMANPPEVLAWNSDKTYLRELEAGGVPIPPTLWVQDPTEDDVSVARAVFGTNVVVVKPTVSGGAWRTMKLADSATLAEPFDGPAMIQPFLPSIESEGETSVLVFDGAVSHVVQKRAAPGDFRIQQQWGGTYATVAEPDPAVLALATRTLQAIGRNLLYARIDMARDADGDWRLMEAELIEPDFYLAQAPDAGRAFARAVRRRLNG